LIIDFGPFRFQVREDDWAYYTKYHNLCSNFGIGKSNRVASSSCGNAHHAYYSQPQDRTLFASSPRVKRKETKMKNDETYQRATKKVEAKIGFYIHLAVYVGVNTC
jgi:hypothetical protein